MDGNSSRTSTSVGLLYHFHSSYSCKPYMSGKQIVIIIFWSSWLTAGQRKKPGGGGILVTTETKKCSRVSSFRSVNISDFRAGGGHQQRRSPLNAQLFLCVIFDIWLGWICNTLKLKKTGWTFALLSSQQWTTKEPTKTPGIISKTQLEVNKKQGKCENQRRFVAWVHGPRWTDGYEDFLDVFWKKTQRQEVACHKLFLKQQIQKTAKIADIKTRSVAQFVLPFQVFHIFPFSDSNLMGESLLFSSIDKDVERIVGGTATSGVYGDRQL